MRVAVVQHVLQGVYKPELPVLLELQQWIKLQLTATGQFCC